MHVHVFVLSTEIMENYPTGWEEEVRVADAVKRLKELKDGGVSTIVDLTVTGLGRYMPRIERVNAEVDINIIAATGLYTYNDVPHYFHFRVTNDVIPALKKRGVTDEQVRPMMVDNPRSIFERERKAY
jgi:phosphotriesterase-related protein